MSNEPAFPNSATARDQAIILYDIALDALGAETAGEVEEEAPE